MMFPVKALRTALALASVAAIAVGIGGCSTQTAEPTKTSTTLTIAVPTARGSFDIVNGNLDQLIADPVFDTLWEPGPNDTFTPRLATKWSYNDDKTALDITLRDGVTDSAGHAYDAEALKTFLDARLKGPFGSRMVGLTGIKVTGKLTVQLELSQASPALLVNLSFDPVSSTSMIGAADAASNPVGTGAYVLDQKNTTVNATYTFTKRKDAWNADAYPYQTVVVKIIPDPTARLNALKSGQVDVAPLDASLTTEAKQSKISLTTYLNDWWGISFVDLAGKVNPAISDVKVRQAISYAFDRTAIAKTLFSGVSAPTEQGFSKKSDYFQKGDDKYAYNVKKAKALLAEAGYPNGFALTMSTFSQWAQYQPIITESLADIGITVTFQTQPDGGSWLMSVPTSAAIPLTDCLCSTVDTIIDGHAPFNPDGNTSPEVAAALAVIGDGNSSAADLKKAQSDLGKYLYDNAWYTVVSYVPSVYANVASVKADINTTNTTFSEPLLASYSPAS